VRGDEHNKIDAEDEKNEKKRAKVRAFAEKEGRKERSVEGRFDSYTYLFITVRAWACNRIYGTLISI
jgi:hypothetical protein